MGVNHPAQLAVRLHYVGQQLHGLRHERRFDAMPRLRGGDEALRHVGCMDDL